MRDVARKMTQAEKAQNVLENDSWGGAITIIAMSIVIGALILLSIFFMGFGKISEKLLSKKKLEAHGRRMRRAYSPWNSKIYNLRVNPGLHKNPARPIPAAKGK